MFLNKSIAIVLLFCMYFLQGTALAQQGESSSSSRSDFDFQISSVFGGYFYQDGTGLIIPPDQINAVDGTFDVQSYQLGPNDIISISIDGKDPIVFKSISINPRGDIVLPILGAISLNGKNLEQAAKLINEKAEETFLDIQTTITLDRLRPVVTHVSGSIPQPGKILMPAFSRVDKAVYRGLVKYEINLATGTLAAENPSLLLNNPTFSIRNIKVSHIDGSSEIIDLVDYYKSGNLDANPLLRDGDIITINKLDPLGPKSSISGFVFSPQVFEFKKGDTPEKLIEIAGGLRPDADQSKLMIVRRTENDLEEIELPSNDWSSFILNPNDRVIILKSSSVSESSSAWIEGEVNIPGNYPIKAGQTSVKDLISVADGLTSEALPSAAFLLRNGYLENEVPTKFNVESMRRTSNQLSEGLQYLQQETSLNSKKVNLDLNDSAKLAEIKLFDGDRLFVPRDENTVFVFGQVNNPGYIPFNGSQNTMDFISNAGGFSLSADVDRVFILKAGSNAWYEDGETTISSGDMIFIDKIPNDSFNSQRAYDIQKRQLRISNTQIVLTAITTITAIVTTVVAIRNN